MDFNSVLAVITVIISITAIVVSFITYRKSTSMLMYHDLDSLYMEVLKLGMANPRFVNPSLTRNFKKSFQYDEALQYDRFAFIVWNVCETIYDHQSSSRAISESWECIIKEELKLHESWIREDANRCRFKNGFLEYLTKINLKITDLNISRAGDGNSIFSSSTNPIDANTANTRHQ